MSELLCLKQKLLEKYQNNQQLETIQIPDQDQ